MGSSSSKPSPPPPRVVYVERPRTPPPPSPPTFKDPWRKIDWTRKQDLQKFVREYQPDSSEVKQLRVLIYGPVGAGKSSFINSIITAIRDRSFINATVNSAETAVKSFTVEYKSYKIKKRGGGHYPIVFNDIMGLEDGENVGVRAEDIQLAMEGHVREGYKFHAGSKLSKSDPYYNPCPTPDDRVHVLVCLLNANSTNISESVIQKMKAIREAARDLGIPQIAIGTHIDECADEIENDVKNVYLSKYLKKKMVEFSYAVGIPLNCIFPVKNYSSGTTEIDDNMDTLLLTALENILNFGDDFLDDM